MTTTSHSAYAPTLRCGRCSCELWRVDGGLICRCGLYFPNGNVPLKESYRHKAPPTTAIRAGREAR